MLLDDIATYLLTKDEKGTITKGHRPDQPDNLTALFPTGGFSHDANLPDVRATVQVLVRDTNYVSAYSRVWKLHNALDTPDNRLITVGARNMIVRAMQPPTFLEFDATNRSIFVFNVAIWTTRD